LGIQLRYTTPDELLPRRHSSPALSIPDLLHRDNEGRTIKLNSGPALTLERWLFKYPSPVFCLAGRSKFGLLGPEEAGLRLEALKA
jgi:hypothetical protein